MNKEKVEKNHLWEEMVGRVRKPTLSLVGDIDIILIWSRLNNINQQESFRYKSKIIRARFYPHK